MDNELLGNLPLQYSDGPDFCTVKDSTGGDFALTVQPELMQLMERAVISSVPLREALEAIFKATELYEPKRAVEIIAFVRERARTALSESGTDPGWQDVAERMREALRSAENAFNAISHMVSIAGLGELTEKQMETFRTRSAVFNVARQTVKEALSLRAVAIYSTKSPCPSSDQGGAA